jgi:hypothetical protein
MVTHFLFMFDNVMHLTNTMTINMFIHFLIYNVVELAKNKSRKFIIKKNPISLI